MSRDLAVVFDVAGTMLKMYRVAKDVPRDVIMDKIVTAELVMEKDGRALVIPYLDPRTLMKASPQIYLGDFFRGRERNIKISCSSTPVTENEAVSVLLGSKAKVEDLQDTLRAVCNRCPQFYYATGIIVDVEDREVAYSVSTGGRPFSGLERVLKELKERDVGIYVASGDSMLSLSSLKRCRGIEPDKIYPASKPRQKEEIVRRLKRDYGRVVMVGDGLNDIYALEAADLGILTVQQDSNPPARLFQAADRIINEIDDLPKILESFAEDAS